MWKRFQKGMAKFHIFNYRDPTVLLGEELEKMKLDNEALKIDLKEKESELENLGCWRTLLSRRKPPVKKLTKSRKKAWMKTKKLFFKNMQIKQ